MRARWTLVLMAALVPSGGRVREDAPPEVVMTFPAQHRARLVPYAVVDRPDGFVRVAFVSPPALAQLRAGGELPLGTTIVLEVHAARRGAQGQLQRDAAGHLVPQENALYLDVMRKRANKAAREDFSFQNWLTGRFDPRTGRELPVNLADCWICHQSVSGRDFVFTRRALLRRALSGRVQRRDCARPERQLCDGDFEQVVGHRP